MLKYSKLIVALVVFLVFCFNINCGSTSRTCPRGCDCIEKLLITNCSAKSQLEYVPHTLNPALKELFLPQNNIRRIDSAFDVYKNLVYLDLTSNRLTIIIDGNFKYNSKLETILLRNNSISTLQPQAFEGLNLLKKLDLSHNRLEAIDGPIFKNLFSLELLDVSFNLLKTLNQITFVGLKNLINLNISNNFISKFSANVFSNVPKLNFLNASSNDLIALHDDWFVSLNELRVLDLGSCRLEAFAASCFNGLNNLTILNLRNNSLMDFPSQSFWPGNVLKMMDISENPFSLIRSSAFANLKYLTKLEITKAPQLQTIHKDAFLGLKSLELLYITDNLKLEQIDRSTFDNLYSLSSLILYNNSFQSLEIDLITRYNKYDLFLDVRGNPFTCNCTLEWLHYHLLRMFNKTINDHPQYFSYNNITFPIYDLAAFLNTNQSEIIIEKNALDVRCVKPLALKDKSIIKLHKDNFACFILESIIPIIIGGIIGLLIIGGVIILLVIQCRNQLSSFVKTQMYTENPPNQFDLYPKPEFVFLSTYNDFCKNPHNFEEFSLRHPLKPTPTTEL